MGSESGLLGAGVSGTWGPLWWWPYLHPISQMGHSVGLGHMVPGSIHGQRTEVAVHTCPLLLTRGCPAVLDGSCELFRTPGSTGEQEDVRCAGRKRNSALRPNVGGCQHQAERKLRVEKRERGWQSNAATKGPQHLWDLKHLGSHDLKGCCPRA